MVNSVLLIGGAPNTGKTTTLNHIATLLDESGYEEKILKEDDKIYLFKGKNPKEKKQSIIINTAADDFRTINNFENSLEENPCDIIITAIRSFGKERKGILDVIKKYAKDTQFKLEIPLAKIIQRKATKDEEMPWYEDGINNLVKYILKSAPFNLKI